MMERVIPTIATRQMPLSKTNLNRTRHQESMTHAR